MQLVIAEKPSVARDLARVLGVRGKGDGALQGEGRVITWCIGHLVELEEPAAYDARWKSWRMDTLPMVPERFKLRPVAGTRGQLRTVRDLLRDRRFQEVVNACDAGREGELIFRYVYELAGSRLPVRRLWISSLTDEAIRQGFARLRPGRDLEPLADAARCRSEADWLVGMNATRAVTLRFRPRDGGAGGAGAAPARTPASGTGGGARGRGRGGRGAARAPVYSIGRVQTPTLAIVVRREQAIRDFVPRAYWEVKGTFTAAAAVVDGASAPSDAGAAAPFTALWTVRTVPPPGKAKAAGGAVTRIGSRALADEIVSRAAASAAHAGDGRGGEASAGPVVESLIEKRSREPPPLLFDLTSLQRTANRRFGMSAARTLEVAQSLYERSKLLTYPRTDARHLSSDLAGEMAALFAKLGNIPAYAPFSPPPGGVPAPPPRRIFDDAKVGDHHAIIPTGRIPAEGSLDRDEQRIFDLVVRRFLGAFHPDAEFALTEVVIRTGAPAPPPVGPVATASSQTAASLGATEPTVADETILEAVPPPPDRFVARGRVRLAAGWQAVAGIDEGRGGEGSRPGQAARGGAARPDGAGDAGGEADLTPRLPPLAQGQRLAGRFEPVERHTRPPPRHTEATLLSAMEYAGRDIDDETLRAAMRDTGLGTPATRAATIETLLARGFIAREAKHIVPTPTGVALIDRLPVPTLASPELTGSWEARLARIARGQEARATFMTDIARFVAEVTSAIRGGPAAAPVTVNRPPSPAPTTPSAGQPGGRLDAASDATAPALLCPQCRQGTLLAGKRGWGCGRWREGCPFVIWFETAGRRLTTSQLRDLVEKGKTRKTSWTPSPGAAPVTGRLVLNLEASRDHGATRLDPC